ncbi:L-lactate permease [Lactobacillus kefiranofaciens subsp. kefirgranum]|uniref:L-lactate permease n=1 Tax=Lactobacillus kefiranofaciens TaxID=267818 RepID=UPI00202EA441|nr:L-lactate permease [Lactobacillus kefiranofaciens]URW70863.1 L-lactate permease [Lactobacillus kefiranofaciens subsp. kefirgranum]URW72807.1 L-lactate permease [Lactobacillus kefiranofaciens subsp. kefirgranum]
MWLKFALALIPIIWLIISLGVMRMPAACACVIGLVLTGVLAVVSFKLPVLDTMTGALEGIIMGIWPIMFVIVMALFAYNVTTESGGMKTIQDMLATISTDKRIIVLIIAWGFGGFLESIAGFGTAVAIAAGILIAFGLDPIRASVISLIANTTATAFGAIGLPILTLAEVTNLKQENLSFIVTLQLFVLVVLVPFILVILTEGSIKAVKGVGLITLMSGLGMAIPQVIAAKFVGAELPAIVGSLCSIAVTVLFTRWHEDEEEPDVERPSMKAMLKACSPFILVFIFVILASSLVASVSNLLNKVTANLVVYTGKDPNTLAISWLTSPGTLLFVSTLIGGTIQGVSFKKMMQVLGQCIKSVWRTTITVCAIVGLAKVMVYAGMTDALAVALVSLLGPVYPLFAPLIGALGTFLTGSATSANVLFGNLQLSAAADLGVSKYWVVASNMTGATAGMLSPQNIAVATGAISREGDEGEILKETVKWGSLYLVVCCIFLYVVGLVAGMI